MFGCKTPADLAAGIATGVLQLHGTPLVKVLNRRRNATDSLEKRSFRGDAAEGP